MNDKNHKKKKNHLHICIDTFSDEANVQIPDETELGHELEATTLL